MKLFLASSLDKTVPLILKAFGQSIRGGKVVFVANAADNHKGDKWWVESDRKAFESLGCKIENMDLRNIDEGKFRSVVKGADIIHFCGGSVLYLISLIRKQRIAGTLTELVKSGDLFYSGTSAGSMIVASDLSLCKYDPEEKDIVENVSDFTGLGIVDFMIIPHADNSGFVEGNKKIMQHLPEYSEPLVVIYDNQVVMVEGD